MRSWILISPVFDISTKMSINLDGTCAPDRTEFLSDVYYLCGCISLPRLLEALSDPDRSCTSVSIVDVLLDADLYQIYFQA